MCVFSFLIKNLYWLNRSIFKWSLTSWNIPPSNCINPFWLTALVMWEVDLQQWIFFLLFIYFPPTFYIGDQYQCFFFVFPYSYDTWVTEIHIEQDPEAPYCPSGPWEVSRCVFLWLIYIKLRSTSLICIKTAFHFLNSSSNIKFFSLQF